jgi:hypothetical protein
MSKLLSAVRLVVRIASGLIIAAAIAMALTVPAPARNGRCHDDTSGRAVACSGSFTALFGTGLVHACQHHLEADKP